MVNRNLLRIAERLGNDIKEKNKLESKVSLPDLGKNPFILSNNEFGREVVRKTNERFEGTRAEIHLKDPFQMRDLEEGEELCNLYMFKRLGMVTTIYHDKNLRSANLWPITPLQSELLLKEGNSPNKGKYGEDLALVLWNKRVINEEYAKALHESLKKYKEELCLSYSNLSSELLIINAGLEKDDSMEFGVKPVVLEGLTKAYTHEIFSFETDWYAKFSFGHRYGLPFLGELGGNRTLYLRNHHSDFRENHGLRTLTRDKITNLHANGLCLVHNYSDEKVTFVKQKI